MSNLALILAGGIGQRCGFSIPKQYLNINGKSSLRLSVESFLFHPDIGSVMVVIGKDHLSLYNQFLSDFSSLGYVVGGDTRQDSVRRGLRAAKDKGLSPKNVLIHDAARPFVSNRLIIDVIDALKNHRAVDVRAPIVDTIRKGSCTIDRKNTYSIQTPQGFHYETICDLHETYAGGNFSDDIALCHGSGVEVGFVRGEVTNVKLTYENDFSAVENLLKDKQLLQRIGMGVDVHKLVPKKGGSIVVCGVKIQCDYMVEAHSDGDVGFHAITEVILGAIAEGNIGTHFPPSDNRWKDRSSDTFLSYANQILKQKGGRINNLDVTVICEEPKIMPYSKEMRENIAKILEINIDQVSVKATTTELMGFLGRKEGIAAQAVGTVVIG